MAEYLIQDTTLTNLGDKIRVLSGSEDAMTAIDMVNKLETFDTELSAEIEKQSNLIDSLLNSLSNSEEYKYGLHELYLVTGEYPDYYSNDICTTIVENRFNGAALKNVQFDNVISIGSSAFANCTSLTEANFPVATSIYTYAFRNCTSLTTANFPSVTTIVRNAFANCTSLTEANFPVATTIGTDAFANCTSLTEANFPVATLIGSYAFYSCYSLAEVNFPLATSIGDHAFTYCSSLTEANFPVATTIGTYAFRYCGSLMNLTISGSSVANLLGVNAFWNTPMSKSTDTGAFGSIYVPASLVDSYKTATNWSIYSARITAIV